MPLGMEVGLVPGDVVLDGDPARLPKSGRSGSSPPKKWPMFIVAKRPDGSRSYWHGGRPQLRRPYGVRWGPSPPSPKKGRAPRQFSAHFYCGQTAGCTKMLLGMELGLSPGDFVLDGDTAPLPKKGAEPPPQFSAHIYCGQTAGWIKMALGMEVGLGPGHIVLDGEPAPVLKKGAQPPPPIFGPFLLSPNGLMNQDGTWRGGGPWSKPHCARWRSSSPPQ